MTSTTVFNNRAVVGPVDNSGNEHKRAWENLWKTCGYLPVTTIAQIVFHRFSTGNAQVLRIKRLFRLFGVRCGVILTTDTGGVYYVLVVRDRLLWAMLRPIIDAWGEQYNGSVRLFAPKTLKFSLRLPEEVRGVAATWGPKRWLSVGGSSVKSAGSLVGINEVLSRQNQ